MPSNKDQHQAKPSYRAEITQGLEAAHRALEQEPGYSHAEKEKRIRLWELVNHPGWGYVQGVMAEQIGQSVAPRPRTEPERVAYETYNITRDTLMQLVESVRELAEQGYALSQKEE